MLWDQTVCMSCGGDGGIDEPGADVTAVEKLEEAHSEEDVELNGGHGGGEE